MLYIYDILLNWNQKKLYDFFEWEATDRLDHIKKIPLFHVEKGTIYKLIHHCIKIKNDFVKKTYNLTEIYTPKRIIKVPYAFLLTDGNLVLAVKTDKQGVVKERSRLLISEEEEILCFANRLNRISLDYEVLGEIDREEYVTRQDKIIGNFLIKQIEESYRNKNYEKLKYLYTEYCGNIESDVLLVYQKLLESIEQGINSGHHKLYDILHLITHKN